MNTKPILERAVELAYSGDYPRNNDLIKKLSREGYSQANQHLDSKSVKKMLNAKRLSGEQHRASVKQ